MTVVVGLCCGPEVQMDICMTINGRLSLLSAVSCLHAMQCTAENGFQVFLFGVSVVSAVQSQSGRMRRNRSGLGLAG